MRSAGRRAATLRGMPGRPPARTPLAPMRLAPRRLGARLVALALLAAFAPGCARGPAPLVETAPVPFTATLGAGSPLVGRAFDVDARREIAWGDLVAALADARFVLVGERHDHPDHHALQARIVRELAARGARPAVAFEMLDAEQSAALAASLARSPRDPDALALAVDWAHSGWPDFALYRPVFAAALDAGLPIVAANAPPARARAVARGHGDPEAKALLARAAPLPAAGRAALSEEIQRGHCGFAPPEMIDAMVEAQRVRDAAMAEALVSAAGAAVPAAILVAGNAHVSHRTGVPLQLAALAPDARVASVAILEVQDGVTDPFAADEASELTGYDYVVFTPRLDDEDPCAKFQEQLQRMQHPPVRP